MTKEFDTEQLSVLGNKVSSEETKGKLEVFPSKRPADKANLTEVTFVTDEVYANCPITGQPDFYSLRATYYPDETCVESKSFKLYIHTLKDSGIFGEALAAAICDHIFEAVNPYYCQVTLIQKPRGGIAIESTACRDRDPISVTE